MPDEQEQRGKNLFHQGEKDPKGCLPLYFCLCALPIALLLIYTQIKMPEQTEDLGEGNIYYKNTPFTYAHAHTQSPLPLNLPSYADPAQKNEFVSTINIEREAEFNAPPKAIPYAQKRPSAILEAANLLELPPSLQVEKKDR